MIHARCTECGHLPDRLTKEFLDNGRSRKRTTRTLGYDETGLEEQPGRHERQAGSACPGVTSEGLPADVNRRVWRPRGALWKLFRCPVSL